MGHSQIYLHLQTFKNRVYLQTGSHGRVHFYSDSDSEK